MIQQNHISHRKDEASAPLHEDSIMLNVSFFIMEFLFFFINFVTFNPMNSILYIEYKLNQLIIM